MMRALCLVSGEFPPEHAALAEAVAASGTAVHVITRRTPARVALERHGGLTVHPVEGGAADEPFAAARRWARAASDAFDEVDLLVHFDAVLAPERRAEALTLHPGALAPLLVFAEDVPGAKATSARVDPEGALLRAMEELALSRADAVVAPPHGWRADPALLAAAVAEAAAAAAPRALLPPGLRQPGGSSPRLGVIVLGTGDAAGLRRSVASASEHAEVPTQVVAVGTAAGLAGCGATLAVPSEGLCAGAARNRALAALSGELDAVGLVRAGSELLARWWEPSYEALSAEPRLFEVTDGGAALRLLRASTFSSVGRFDEDPARDPDVELARRAARLGFVSSEVLSGRVAPLAAEGGGGTTRRAPLEGSLFVALCSARAVLQDPMLLAAWSAAFTAADEAVLALYGPGEEPAAYVEELAAAAARVAFDLEEGPRVVVKLPPVADADFEQALGDEALALLGDGPDARFPALAAFSSRDHEALRLLAARFWRARPAA